MEGSRGAWQSCRPATPAPGTRLGPHVGRHDCRRASDFWHRLEHLHGAHSLSQRRRRLRRQPARALRRTGGGCACRRSQRRRGGACAKRSRLDDRLHCHVVRHPRRAHEHGLDVSWLDLARRRRSWRHAHRRDLRAVRDESRAPHVARADALDRAARVALAHSAPARCTWRVDRPPVRCMASLADVVCDPDS